MRSRVALVAVSFCLFRCASYTALSPDDRAALERDLGGKDADKFLKLSEYVTPFFGDTSKKFLTPLPPDEVRLLNELNGQPVNPGPVEQTLPAGTRVHILQAEFPTSWVVGMRIPYTPRTQPWVYLSVEGQPKELPYILVLRPQIKSREEFLAELERYLSNESPERTMALWAESVRQAVKDKTALVDMPAEALEMAWGYPELKQITYEGQVKKEKWTYPGEKRVASLSDGRVTQLVDKK